MSISRIQLENSSYPEPELNTTGQSSQYSPLQGRGGPDPPDIGSEEDTYSQEVQNWLQKNGTSDPIFQYDQQNFGDSDLECTQYINDMIYQATGFNLGQAVWQDMASQSWGNPFPHTVKTNGGDYNYSSPFTDSGAAGLQPGSLREDNWETFFKRQGVFHPIGQKYQTGAPGATPSDLRPGDVLLMHDQNGHAHVALVMNTDGLGHPTKIAESTGGAGNSIKIKSWDDGTNDSNNNFMEALKEQGWTLDGYGRPGDLNSTVLTNNNDSLEPPPPSPFQNGI